MAEKPYRELSANQVRVQVDTAQTFEAYRDVQAARRRFAGGMTWRTVGGREYLIKILDRNGRTKSLGCGARQNESGSAQQNEAIRVTGLGATFVTLSLRISGAGTVAGSLGVPAELGSW